MKGQAKRTKLPATKAGAATKTRAARRAGTTATVNGTGRAPAKASRTVTAGRASATRAAKTLQPEGYLEDPPSIERRKSKVHGWGVFALQAIPKNKRIIHYAGERISSKESTPREERYLAKGHIWCFKVNNRTVIDAAVGGNVARFINHACKPNCYTEIKGGTIWIRAGRSIRRGEELTYNYYTEGCAEIPCRCTPGCQGML